MPRLLDPALIAGTARVLSRRVEERFPGSGLSGVAKDLLAAAEDAGVRSDAISRAYRPLRLLTWGLAATLAAGLGTALTFVSWGRGYETASDLLQGVDAAANLVLLLGAAIFSTSKLEERLRRNRALAVVHELKALAHVVDMHQLSKRAIEPSPSVPDTASSPKRLLTPAELDRYLDYCAEIFAVIGKVAALYGQRLNDPVVLEAVDDIEDLTTSLARKVWQKIAVLERRRDASH
jgi:hypothetical protein